jgi:hypothetical protein
MRFSVGTPPSSYDIGRSADGSVDLCFDLVALEDFEKNWIERRPGEGWFTLPQLYTPRAYLEQDLEVG